MDKFQEMRVFSAVVDAGSFVAAATALGLSKAAVSRHVSELEQRLGVRLLHRTTRRLSLTADGELFHARCRDILASVQESEDEVSMRAGKASGLLKVSVPLSFGIKRLAPLWPDFLRAHPLVALDVNLSDRRVDLVEEGFDLAIRIGALPDSSMVSRKIGAARPVLCASPDYVRRRGAPEHPSDLKAHEVIAYTLSSQGDQWTFDGPEGTVTVKVAPRFSSNNGDTCVVVALGGMGIIRSPDFLVGEHLRAGSLVELLPLFRPAELNIFALYPSRKQVAPKVRLFIEHLTRSLNSAP